MPAGRVLDAQLHLLDRQVLDKDGVPVGVVDDISLDGVPVDEDIAKDAAPPVLGALLFGPVLGTRIFGGRPPASRLEEVPWSAVADVGTALHLGVRGEHLVITWTERWVRDHIISRIPGGRHDPH